MNPLTSIIKSKKDKPMYEPPTGVVPFPLPPLISTGTAHIKPSDEANAAIECNVNSGGTVNIENRNDGLLNIESVAALLPEKMVDDPSSKFIALDSATNNKEESRLKEAIRKARKIAASMSASSMFVDEIITVLEKEADELRHQQCEDDFRRKEEEVLQKGKKKETRVTMSSVEYVDSIINILENEAEQERGGGGSSSSSSSSSHGDDIYDKTTIASKIDEESCPFEFELLLPPKKNISVLLQSSNEKDKKKKKKKSASKGKSHHVNYSTTKSGDHDNKSVIHNGRVLLNNNNNNSKSSSNDICNSYNKNKNNNKQHSRRPFDKAISSSTRNRRRRQRVPHGIGTKVVRTIVTRSKTTPKHYFQFEGYIDNQQCETCDVPCVIS
eukprot:CAMPEP_0185253086 /NCGR_PEP_ID=MMETSP1359-20130426/1985_1 /TAXON_ID=552665 /ORGANISM="Bigelowiella longifila, Strain CCMP242" /LENGTH=383 /DNA_ID=CAMNT_0027835411 /DNA_START=51 /DNA_END=1202 /DNA_ORIENTATION=-